MVRNDVGCEVRVAALWRCKREPQPLVGKDKPTVEARRRTRNQLLSAVSSMGVPVHNQRWCSN